jgi:hypothetical protein
MSGDENNNITVRLGWKRRAYLSVYDRRAADFEGAGYPGGEIKRCSVWARESAYRSRTRARMAGR